MMASTASTASTKAESTPTIMRSNAFCKIQSLDWIGLVMGLGIYGSSKQTFSLFRLKSENANNVARFTCVSILDGIPPSDYRLMHVSHSHKSHTAHTRCLNSNSQFQKFIRSTAPTYPQIFAAFSYPLLPKFQPGPLVHWRTPLKPYIPLNRLTTKSNTNKR